MRIRERRAAGLAVLAMLVLLAAGGCGRRERTVMPVTIDERIGSAAPRHPKDFSSHEAVVRGVLHNEGAPPSSRYWMRLIAHELTHVAQIELAGSEGQAEQWLT